MGAVLSFIFMDISWYRMSTVSLIFSEDKNMKITFAVWPLLLGKFSTTTLNLEEQARKKKENFIYWEKSFWVRMVSSTYKRRMRPWPWHRQTNKHARPFIKNIVRRLSCCFDLLFKHGRIHKATLGPIIKNIVRRLSFCCYMLFKHGRIHKAMTMQSFSWLRMKTPFKNK